MILTLPKAIPLNGVLRTAVQRSVKQIGPMFPIDIRLRFGQYDLHS